MNSDRFANFDSEVKDLVLDFERTVMRGESQFYDVDEFEIIIDYYLEVNDLEPLEKAVGYALSLYPDSTSIRLRQAHLFLAQLRYADALNLLLDLRKCEPENTDLAYSLGVAYGATGMSDQAIECYLQAATDGWELGRIYTNIAEEYLKQKQYPKAAEYYLLAMDTDSYEDATLYGYLEACESYDALDVAIEHLQLLVRAHPYDAVAWYCLGRAQMLAGLYEKATDAFEYATAIDKRMLGAYEELSYCREMLGHTGEASEALMRLLEAGDQPATVYRLLGGLYMRSNNKETALLYFRKAIMEDPADASSLAQMAGCYLALNDLPMAVSTVKKALAVDPDNADTLCAAALVSDSCNKTDQAADYFERMLATENYNEQHCQCYTTFLFNHKRYEQLIDFAEESLGYFPHDAFYSTYLTAAYYCTNRYNKARARIGDAYTDLLLDLCPELGANRLFSDLLPEESRIPVPPFLRGE